MQIDLKTDWEGAFPTLLEVACNGATAAGRREARDHLRNMAILADTFGKEMVIEVFPMNSNDSLADIHDEVVYYDILVRPDGGDPILEFENLTEVEAEQQLQILEWRYPGFPVSDLRELLR